MDFLHLEECLPAPPWQLAAERARTSAFVSGGRRAPPCAPRPGLALPAGGPAAAGSPSSAVWADCEQSPCSPPKFAKGCTGVHSSPSAAPPLPPPLSLFSCVAVVFGSTYNGEFEDVAAIDAMLTGEASRPLRPGQARPGACVSGGTGRLHALGADSPDRRHPGHTLECSCSWEQSRPGPGSPPCFPADLPAAAPSLHPPAAAELNAANGWNASIHVDGASGAFVAPFLVRGERSGERERGGTAWGAAPRGVGCLLP